jgi:DNA-directed RNA polymerase specialized sigma24 family protein
MANLDISDDDLAQVRAALVRSMPTADADREDMVQEALIRLVQEPPPAKPVALIARAHRRLHHAKVEHFRRLSVRPPLAAVAPHLESQSRSVELGISEDEATRRIVELARRLEELVGTDAVEFVLLKRCGYTESEIAARPGWNPRRAGAARKRLARLKEQFPNLVSHET